MNRTYIAIDLKSFYASVECEERGLNPLDALLVVADESRTDKTICLAVSPALKAYSLPGRARLFEVREKQKEVNAARKAKAPGRQFSGSSYLQSELQADPSLSMDIIAALPRMRKYMEVSRRIFGLYKRFISPEDIHVYSIDEVFIDATGYLEHSGMSARAFALNLVRKVLEETGITATCGIGENLYLCKVAMDIVAKHMPPDQDGVRIAELTEQDYREQLWSHLPLTDFWRIGPGISAKLGNIGLYTMGDIALFSLTDGDTLYRLFGINAELLIDHAWGWESCTIRDIKDYCPETESLSSGQVLSCPYQHEKALLVLKEMADALALALVEKRKITQLISLTVCYDVVNLEKHDGDKPYRGQVETDRYGRRVPKAAHGSIRIGRSTSSSRLIISKTAELFENITDRELLIRRIYISADELESEENEKHFPEQEQTSLFCDQNELDEMRQAEKSRSEKERKLQQAVVDLKNRFGKNSVLKGMNLEEGATAAKRNDEIGGHRA